jgi:hypothetical protein
MDVKAFLSIKDFDGINIYGRIVFIYWQISFLMGRFMGGLWAVQGFNVEEREEQNTKECDEENSGRLLADCIFMGGSNYLRADLFIYGQMQYP